MSRGSAITIIAELAAACVLLGATAAMAQSAQGHGGYVGPSSEQPVLTDEQKAKLARMDDFQTAVLKNDAARLKAMIRAGMLVDFNFDDVYRGRTSESPLTMAIGRGLLDIARILLDSGADPNRRDGWGTPPMHRAQSAAAIALLLDHGGDMNVVDKRGMSALADAIERRDAARAELLAAHGARADAPRGGADLFTLAVQRHNPDAVRLLLARGADPRSPPTQAIWVLIEQDDDGETARLLFEKGADPNAKNDRDTLLSRAIFRSRWRIVQSLGDAGATLQPPDGPECAAAMRDCRSIEVARLASLDAPALARLKARGLDLDRQAANGHTALTSLLVEPPAMRVVAISADGRLGPSIEPPDEVARVRALLEQGANPNRRYREFTPLMLAAGIPQKPRGVADVLFEFGGRVEYEGTIAKAPSDKPLAATPLPATPTSAIAMLSESPVDTNQGITVGMKIGPLTWLALHGRGDLAARSLARDRTLAASDRFLAYFAGRLGQWDLALEGIKYVRDVDAGDRAGVTPLILAADAGRADVVKALIAKGANVNARSATDWPPIWETSPLMLLGGHSPSKPPLVGGYTPLKAARERGRDEVTTILLKAGARD